ncbi:MAG: hypothetical protein LBM59_06235 [Ruminococcus sp.]|jgi:hypothetical protein|nr:hypothetical protein [Ruminococcus sp.]
MATQSEIILNFVVQYRLMLKNIQIFSTRFPSSIDEYNYLVDMASELLETANTMGLTSLPPLPPKK